MVDPAEIMTTMKDIVDAAARTGTWEELRDSESWTEYEFRCRASNLDPIGGEYAALYYAYRPKRQSQRIL